MKEEKETMSGCMGASLRQLQKEKDRVLAGKGAKAYARSKKHADYDPVTEETWSEWNNKIKKRKA